MSKYYEIMADAWADAVAREHAVEINPFDIKVGDYIVVTIKGIPEWSDIVESTELNHRLERDFIRDFHSNILQESRQVHKDIVIRGREEEESRCFQEGLDESQVARAVYIIEEDSIG